jgi:hypothetical protein
METVQRHRTVIETVVEHRFLVGATVKKRGEKILREILGVEFGRYPGSEPSYLCRDPADPDRKPFYMGVDYVDLWYNETDA